MVDRRILAIHGVGMSNPATSRGPSEARFLDKHDVARVLNLSPDSAWWLIRTRALASTKIGRLRMVDRADLEAYIARRRTEARDPARDSARAILREIGGAA